MLGRFSLEFWIILTTILDRVFIVLQVVGSICLFTPIYVFQGNRFRSKSKIQITSDLRSMLVLLKRCHATFTCEADPFRFRLFSSQVYLLDLSYLFIRKHNINVVWSRNIIPLREKYKKLINKIRIQFSIEWYGQNQVPYGPHDALFNAQQSCVPATALSS